MEQKHIEYVRNIGRQAKRNGLPETANPYIVGDIDCKLWLEGWQEENAKSPVKPMKTK